jgi:hypothetical protein
VDAQLHTLVRRMIGLEKQIGPFAVAEQHGHVRWQDALKADKVVAGHRR